MPTTDEEIRAMLNTDPEGFIALMTRARPVIEVPLDAARGVSESSSKMPPPSPSAVPASSAPAVDPSSSLAAKADPAWPEVSPEVVAQMQEAAGLHEAADQTRSRVPGSPLAGVSDDAWREFVARLERESPSFNSSRHVGQYRQRRERLTELGVDLVVLLGSAQAQRAALDADLVDAHHHAAHGGLFAQHLGRALVMPGREDSEVVSLSGMLGVIQCAGLDGAVGWFERPNDRKRYPHTTQAFLRTNGVF